MDRKHQRTRPHSPTRPRRVREEPPVYTVAPSSGDDDDEERLEQFLEYLRTIEGRPSSTLARQLIEDGIELPPPGHFDERTVHDKLWEVIHGLARRRHYLSSTNHLSELELYRHLWEETLSEPTYELTDTMGTCARHLDLVSDGSEESVWLWLRYYASESARLDWAADFPGDGVPPALKPPFDRDRFLPQAPF